MTNKMLGLVYLLVSFGVGIVIMRAFFPSLVPRSLSGAPAKGGAVGLVSWMVTWPGAFLVGTLVVTWITYLAAYLFRLSARPLLYGNIISFTLFGLLLILYWFRHRPARSARPSTGMEAAALVARFYREHQAELLLILAVLVVWGYLMFHSFRVGGGQICVGTSVYSDFGPHLAMIRSFSRGSNFPTEYPYFPDGHIRYHFMFHFLSGNLEFLGLPLDWAFNLPSILGFLAFMMLLYALAVAITGAKTVGILTCVMFFFRSSFAFFTFLKGKRLWPALLSLLTNADHIGRTRCENWGLWAQKTFVNQRHFPFSFGVMLLILLAMLPRVREMAGALKEARKGGDGRRWWREFLLKEDGWAPADWRRWLAAGAVLGLLAFWNGAVLIAALSVLPIMAVFSKRRFEYFNIAAIAMGMALLQTAFFVGPDNAAVQPRFVFGFLAEQPTLKGVIAYYIELLGMFPFVFLAGVALAPEWARSLAAAFIVPLVFATTVQLTPDIAVNHKYVMISVTLLNLFAAYFVHRLYTRGFSPAGERASGAAPLREGNMLEFRSVFPFSAPFQPGVEYGVTGRMRVCGRTADATEAVFRLKIETNPLPAAEAAAADETGPG
ncbi:MAG: hypothetical protein K6U74_01740, partial [Firmicutes bacterium]|nr:hypothetical protein [Bacillota bacterium]